MASGGARRRLLASLGCLLVAVALAPPSAAQEGTRAGAVTFADAGYGDVSVRGRYGTATFFFPLAAGRAVSTPARLDLDVSHSPLLLPDVSTMTVVVNGTSLTSAYLDGSLADHGRLSVEVPSELLGGAGTVVEVRYFLRLTRDECEEPTNPALWATVHRSSTLSLDARPQRATLADLPALLADPRAEGGVRLVLPDGAEVDSLGDAAAAAAQLGRWHAATRTAPVLDVGTEPAQDRPSIVIGGDELGIRADDPLVVTSGPDASRAMAVLASPVVEQVDGRRVTLGDVAAVPDPAASSAWRRGAASFAQLGVERRDLNGPGTHVVDLVVERPPGWTMDEDGSIELVLDAATGAREGDSFVRVAVDGNVLGTRSLRVDGDAVRYTFRLPAGLADARLDGRPARSLGVQVTVHLEPDLEPCEPLAADAVRASLLETSVVRLPHDEHDGRDLGRFPHRLHDGAGNRAVVVLPSEPDATTVTAGLQLVAAIARWAEPGLPSPTITTTDALQQRDRAGRSLVLVGTADEELGEPIDVGASAVASEAGAVVANLGMARSPWAGLRTVLAVHGEPEALLLAARALAGDEVTTGMTGSRVAIVGDAAQATAAATGATPPFELAPVVEEQQSRTKAVVAVVVLVAFVVVAGGTAWYRWGRRRRA